MKQEAIDASSALSALQACPACGSATPHMHRFTVNGCAIWQCQICGLGRARTEGFEPSAYDDLLKWSDDLIKATTSDPEPEIALASMEASMGFRELQLGVIADRRARPQQSDLISLLCHLMKPFQTNCRKST